MSIHSWLMARFYDTALGRMEAACLQQWRAELLSRASGDVLEIGSGTGANLRHYPADITSLTLTEPDPHMRRMLQRNVAENPRPKLRLEPGAVEEFGFSDQAFDTIVSTLVLCSVTSPQHALVKIRQSLKPNGKFLFIEHVLAADRPRLLKWQRLVQPLWIPLSGNCHLTRDTERLIREAGFGFELLDHRTSRGGLKLISPRRRSLAI